ncbi:hypothetical protein ATO13_08666 [Stappia sp. 22II-S9-Z10]|nr:hypothetical protein ATO13_08666 [Stappia sp. 22II-S9-Z10]
MTRRPPPAVDTREWPAIAQAVDDGLAAFRAAGLSPTEAADRIAEILALNCGSIIGDTSRTSAEAIARTRRTALFAESAARVGYHRTRKRLLGPLDALLRGSS